MTNLAEQLGFILSNQSSGPCVVQHPSDCHRLSSERRTFRFPWTGTGTGVRPMFYLSPLPLWLIRHYNDIFEIWSYILNCQRNASCFFRTSVHFFTTGPAKLFHLTPGTSDTSDTSAKRVRWHFVSFGSTRMDVPERDSVLIYLTLYRFLPSSIKTSTSLFPLTNLSQACAKKNARARTCILILRLGLRRRNRYCLVRR